MVTAVPASIEALYEKCDLIIDQQIMAISHGRCPRDERRDIKQDVYMRAIGKNFLARTRELFEQRGGGCFEHSLFRLTRSVAVNHFEHNACRPLHHVVAPLSPEMQDVLLADLFADAEAMVNADFARQLAARDHLDKFGAWLQTRRGRFATRHRRHAAVDITEVYRLWRLYGESRQVTREIAQHLQLTEPWVRHLKAVIRKSFSEFNAGMN